MEKSIPLLVNIFSSCKPSSSNTPAAGLRGTSKTLLLITLPLHAEALA
jgi:hypothetical protein